MPTEAPELDFRLNLDPFASTLTPLRPVTGTQLVAPGDVVTTEAGFLKGRGLVQEEDGALVASVCGVVEQVDKLIFVRPLKHRYIGNIGDVIIGRIEEVLNGRWAVDVGSSTNATLHLAAINLPGNVQRRRTDEDELQMRQFFKESDVLCAEVQKVQESGEVVLQTRSAKYGKLQNGMLVEAPAALVRRQPQHIVTTEWGVQLVLGNNGWIWVGEPPRATGGVESLNFSQMDVSYELVDRRRREEICFTRNCVKVLAKAWLEISVKNITSVREAAKAAGLTAKDLIKERAGEDVTAQILVELSSA